MVFNLFHLSKMSATISLCFQQFEYYQLSDLLGLGTEEADNGAPKNVGFE